MKHPQVSFVVPDRRSVVRASQAQLPGRVPRAPQLRKLDDALLFGERLLGRLRQKPVQIVEQQGISLEEAYRANERTYEELVEQRNNLVGVIEKMLQPTINVVQEHSKELEDRCETLENHEGRIKVMETMMRAVFGKAPDNPRNQATREVWQGSLHEAAAQVTTEYRTDNGSSKPRFRSLRDASDCFVDTHIFLHKPRLTKDQFYENVKKA
jgi:hypothetical protein